MKASDFVCVRCGAFDTGKFCSTCGGSLLAEPHDFPALYRAWLVSAGYADLHRGRSIGTGGGAAAQTAPKPLFENLTTAVQDSLAAQSGVLLAIDRSNIQQLQVVYVPALDRAGETEIRSSVLTLIGDLKAAVPHINETHWSTIAALEVVVYVASDTGDPQALVSRLQEAEPAFRKPPAGEWLRRQWAVARASWSRKKLAPWVRVRWVAIDLAQMAIHPSTLMIWDPEKQRMLRSVLRQLQAARAASAESSEDSVARSIAAEAVYKPFAAFGELFWLFIRVLTRPMHYAAEVDDGRLRLSHAISYLALLTVFVMFVDKATGLNEFAFINVMPIVDEVLAFFFLLLIQALAAGLLYVALRLVGGKGSWSKTLTAQIVLTVVFLPIAELVDAAASMANREAYASQSVTPGTRVQNGLTGMYLIPVLAVVHHVSRKRVFFGLMLLVFGVIITIGFFAAMVAVSPP